jgi:hypothetical protein
MEMKAQVEQIKGEKQTKEVVVGEEYITNTGTLDGYFVLNNKAAKG